MNLSIDDYKKILLYLAGSMSEHKQELIELDSIMGDSDLGLTMEKAFSVSSKAMQDSTETDIGKFLFQTGMAMSEAAPSSMGTLIASAFMQAGKNLKGKTETAPEDWKLFAVGLRDGIVNRGKAVPGEKTIVDVLVPVAQALENDSSGSHKEIFERLETVAAEALEKTKTMKAQHGRAAYFGDKSIGVQDAGATVAYIIYKSLSNYFKE
ncbi:MAG: dihydroxyacetone kinase subunit L [Spirochaeta sp. LUC14_002_19_P3]|nr:MAG: dihydroxyacetone kinase subunit L [Spirochaeta sp. LUC14_002_19_P3]